MPQQAKTLYADYKSDESVRDLINDNMGLVKSLANRFDVTFQPALCKDDLISAGTLGLVEAAHRYEKGKNTKFSTFAYQRIRGAMLDLLRAEDPLGKSARSKLAEIRKAINDYKARFHQNPTIDELADILNVSSEEVIRYLSYEKWDYVGSISRLEKDSGEDESTLDALLRSDIDTPLDELEKNELAQKMAETLKTLSEREQQVIVMYYYEELNMAEIAEVLGITQSRVSQIHTKGIYNLGRKLRGVIGDK